MLPRLPRGAAFATIVTALAMLAGGSFLLPARGICAPSPATASAGSESGNLLTGEQALSGNSTGGWIGKGAELGWVANVGGDPGALEMSLSGPPPAAASGQWVSAWSAWPSASAQAAANLTPAVPGRVYEGDARVMAVDGGGVKDGVDAALGFWNSQGVGLSWAPATIDQVGPGSWATTSMAVAIAPPGAAYVALGVMEWTSTGSWDLYVSGADLRSVVDNPSAVIGPLRTNGRQILQGNGVPVTLRGIAYLGLATSSHPSDLTKETFVRLHNWGFTMVRLFLNEDLWDTQSCAYDPAYRMAVEQAVSWTTSLGMVALLTMPAGNPQDIGATGPCPSPTEGGANMADAPGSDDFWSSAAAQFKGNPLVAFDLFNEPNGISAQVWLNGGPQNGFQGEGMQELYNDVRKTGATNLTFVEGYNWASSPPPSGDLLNGYNVVYDAHYYTCPHATPPQCTAPDPYNPDAGLAPWVTFQVENNLPVVVGEFGWPSTGDGTYVGNVIAYAEAQGWGWAAYTFDSYTGDPFDLVGSVPSSGPFEPSPSGMPVLADLALESSTSQAPGTTQGTTQGIAQGTAQVPGTTQGTAQAPGTTQGAAQPAATTQASGPSGPRPESSGPRLSVASVCPARF